MDNLQDFCGGERLVFERLYAQCAPKCIRFSRKIGLTKEEAEDCFQESIALAYEKLCGTDPTKLTSALCAYIMGINRRKALEILRKKLDRELRKQNHPHNKSRENDEMTPEEKEASRLKCKEVLKRTFSQLGQRCQKLFGLGEEGKTTSEILIALNIENANALYALRFACRKTWTRLITQDEDYNACKRLRS